MSVPRITVTPVSDHGASFRFLDRRYGELTDADEALEGFQVDLESSINVIRVWVSSPDDEASHAYNIEVRRLDLNAEPAFQDGEGNPITTTTRSISENAPAGAHIGAPVAAADSEDDPIAYSLSGPSGAYFDIDPSTGQLLKDDHLSYETKSEHTVQVTATDALDANSTITFTITVTDATTGSATGDRYDADGSGTIDRSEVLRALADYLAGSLTRDEAEAIFLLYTSG